MAILKVLLIIVVSIIISGLQSYSVYRWLLNTDYKEPFNPFAPFENALIGAVIAGIIFASINSSIMYWIIF